jgi:beta-phosphoglucomutase
VRRAVIFDYNGVIVDDERIHKEAFAIVLREVGISLNDALYNEHFLGRTDGDGFASLRTAFTNQFEESLIKKLTEEKLGIYLSLLGSEDIIYPEAEEVICRLACSFRLGVVTSSSRNELLAVLGRSKLVDKFSCLVTAEDTREGKPDPEGYLRCLQLMAVSSDAAVAIEDSPSGVQAAKAAQLKCIAVLHTTVGTKLQKADSVIPTIGYLTERLVESVIGSHISPASDNSAPHGTPPKPASP